MSVKLPTAAEFFNHITSGENASRDIPLFISSSSFAGFPDELNNCFLLPGLTDVHVHLREPGFSYKETIKSGTLAAARGGFTTVCPMPNLNPVPDSVETLEQELRLIRRDACINVVPYGAITCGEKGEALADMAAIAPHVAGFSDDGRGVQDGGLMRAAMQKAKELGKLIVAHCEDNSLLDGGYIHDGEYARRSGHKGISSASEYRQIERDLELVRDTGCGYHICHVSAAESVELIRTAKREGLDVSCETAPHYLTLCDMDLQEHGRFKMNPPLRSVRDRDALIEGVCDGTIEMIATDHAPHSAEEKGRGLRGSMMGVTGLETAFPVLYTELVRRNVISLEKLTELMSAAPRRRFGLPGGYSAGDFTLFDLDCKYKIDPAEFASLGRATPFEGREVFGRCLMTARGGETVWSENLIKR